MRPARQLNRGSALSARGARSESPTKRRGPRGGPPGFEDPDEVDEPIEAPDGQFNVDKEDSDIECLGSDGRRDSKSFTMVADRTRGAARLTIESASPTKPVADQNNKKGKERASATHATQRPTPAKQIHITRQSSRSTSPVKPQADLGHTDPKGKGKAVDEVYVELDDRPASNGDEEDHSYAILGSTSNKIIPSSGVGPNCLRYDTKVVRCADMMGQSRKMWVRQIEIHPNDGISLGDAMIWKRSNVFIKNSNITETQVCSGAPITSIPADMRSRV